MRRSDGTIVIAGQRFEIPSCFRHLHAVSVRYARWDLGHVEMVDPRTDVVLAALGALDKARNADGRRPRAAPLALGGAPATPPDPPRGMPALLRKLLAEMAATGAPPGYLPMRSHRPDRGPDALPLDTETPSDG